MKEVSSRAFLLFPFFVFLPKTVENSLGEGHESRGPTPNIEKVRSREKGEQDPTPSGRRKDGDDGIFLETQILSVDGSGPVE